MTPAQILDSVKLRFSPLLIREPDTQTALLRKALAAYQDRAGVLSTVILNQGDVKNVPVPADCLALIHVVDSNGGLVFSDIIGQFIVIDLDGYEKFPLRMSYFVNLRDSDHDSYTVPADAVGLIEDYLEALFNVQNTSRLRRVEISGKFDASNLPDETTLHQRVLDLEDKMAATRAIVPGVTLI